MGCAPDWLSEVRFKGDPLTDLAVLEHVEGVIKDGRTIN
jgi:hypothetical protein